MQANMSYRNPMNPLTMKNSDGKKLLNDIGMIDFVVVEMAEYLDTHPYDKEAIDYFNYYVNIKNSLMKEFAEKCWPLTLATAGNSEKEWDWAKQDPPWKGMGK